MNYLAHIWLSGSDLHWQLGGFLGDFIKGPLPERLQDAQGDHWPNQVREGVYLHRKVDARLDRDDRYRACVAELGSEFRRFGPVALDVYFDHLLVQHWPRFSSVPLTLFNQRFYEITRQLHERLPEPAGRFLARARSNDLLARYGQESVFLDVLSSIDRRFRVASNVYDAGERVLQCHADIEADCLAVLDEFSRWAAQHRQLLADRRPRH